ncbi:MAG: glycosyltransferase family 4 protein [Pseudomonadota bacterium]
MSAAIYFEPDAFVVEGRQVMGRRAAGASFLRAAVQSRGQGPVTAYVRTAEARSSFLQSVAAIDPAAPTHCISAGALQQLASCGLLYRPDPMIAAEARLRLRQGARSYSLCGITHTISSSGVLEELGRLVTEPVMEWDALICTSTVAREVVQASMDAAWDQARWLTGATRRPPSLQLPVIPLGVHCSDWEPAPQKRDDARARWTLAEDDVALLFAGRLSYAGKAHPFQMFEAMQAVAARTGKRIVLLMAGQYFLNHVQQAFEQAARALCPDIRFIHVDGAAPGDYAAAFAAADIFLSLADSHQETFGITPIEAMASGLPVLVTDWNGYRDTVRDGVDGFRIPTWSPAPGTGASLSAFYESTGAFEVYSARASGGVSIEMAALADRLERLVIDADLRRTFGAAGRARAAAVYDWAVIYRHYQELWVELAARRTAAATPATTAWLQQAPAAHHAFPDPYERFASYTPNHISRDTPLRRGTAIADHAEIAALEIFAHLRFSPELATKILQAVDREAVTVGDVAGRLGVDLATTTELVARLAKMNLLILQA